MTETPTDDTREEARHEGGCHCGAVRYRTTGWPHRTGVCHCRYCQTRTGSAFGVSVYFDTDQIELLQGDLVDYRFETESGREFVTRFCPVCGTTVFWTLEMFAGATAVAGGTFDPPTFWYDVDREVFARTKAPFVALEVTESHATTPSFEPKSENAPHLRGR